MGDLFRDSAAGQVIRFITRDRILQYPEEKPDFKLPETYISHTPPADTTSQTSAEDVEPKEELEKVETAEDTEPAELEPVHLSRTHSNTMAAKLDGLDLEKQVSQHSLRHEPSRPIVPVKTSDGLVLVDWYRTDDPENPQNWSAAKKAFALFQICIYTTGIYMGSSIYAASEPGVTQVFGVSITAAELGLSLFVLGYAFGPMIWSPLSEFPAVGRNPPYIATFAIFVILCVPTALVDNFAGLLVLRFLQGLFGSPALATGGASIADIYPFLTFPYVLALWAFAATCGPALGPLISGFSVAAENWRWSLWEMLWLSGPIFVVLFFGLPETYAPNILLRRAKRIRALTGDPKYMSQSEIDQKGMSVSQTLKDVLVKPFQLNALDPAVLFTTVYVGLIYGIYYSFFEVFPFVFGDIYHFNAGEQGLAYLSITVGVGIAMVIYFAYIYYVINPTIIKTGSPGEPERRLVPALFSSLLLPIGLFIFAWTSRESIHWIAPVIGLTVFSVGIFIVIQCIFVYLPMTYPQYAASLFAGNDFFRSTLAAGAVLFSRPTFLNLGVGPGVSLLAALTAACVAGVYCLWWFGGALRARSRFTQTPSKVEPNSEKA